MKLEGSFLVAVFFMCLVNRHLSLKPPDQEHRQSSSEPQEETPKNEKAIINKDISELDEVNVQESVGSETPALLVAPSLSTEGASATGELSEQAITPTVAPATPSYDVEPTMPPSYSVVHDTSPGGAMEEASDGVQLPEPLKTSVDSSPPVPVSNEPAPNPDPADISEAKAGEDSITSILKEAEENKPKEDEMPSFDEFKRQMLKEEEEKIKQQNTQDATGIPIKPKLKKAKKRKQTNYASVDCGAKVLNVNPEASNAEAILTENPDIYMLNPCSVKIFFVVELCDTAHVKSIDIANFELFSSMPESFRVFVSNRYPTREWSMLGTFQATDQRDVQSFPLDEPIYAKYLKVEMLSHFGSEHYCPLSLLRVYGISMMEELEDQETGQDEGEVSEGEAEDDVIQILPPDPSAKEDELKKKGILEKAADSVMSFVKKFVSGDDTNNGSSDNSKVKVQQNIVTLIEKDEGEENVADVNEAAPASSESHKVTASLGSKSESKPLQPRTAAPTPCEAFIKHLRHPSFGCFNGSIFYCKKYQNLTITTESLQDRSGAPRSAKQKVPIVRKLDVSDEEKQNTKQKRTEESKSVKEYWKRKRKNANKLRARKLQKRVQRAASEMKSAVKRRRRAALQLSEQHVEQSKASATTSVRMTVTVASAAQPSMPRKSSTQASSSSVEEHSTPAVSPVTSVTTQPQPDNSPVSVLPSVSTVSEEAIVVEPVGENAPDLSKTDDQKPIINKEVKSSEEKYPESSSTESESSPSSVSSQTVAVSESLSAAVISEASTSENIQASVHSAEKKLEEESVGTSVVSPTTAVQPECTAVNSIELINQNSPDVDILEIKLTDSSGKEGTAELHQPDNSDSSVDDKPDVQQAAAEGVGDAAGGVVSEQLREPSSSEQQEKSEDEKTDNKEAEKPANSGIVSPASSESGSLLESEPPRQAPPVVTQDVARLASVCSPDSAASTAASSELSSKAAQQASMSLGLGPGMASGQKESIFMRLSNRIKALEQNLTLSTLYMEQINQRYRKNLDELLKNFDKKMTLLSNATKQAEVVINGQKEQISQLQEQLDKTSAVVSELKQKMASVKEEVMERHVIGLVMEVILIMVLMLMFRRCERQRAPHAITPGATPIQNGTGPPRLLHKDYHHGDAMAEKKKGEVREEPAPEIIRAASVPTGAEDRTKDSTGTAESKKKKHKRRSRCLEPALAPAVATDASPQNPPSVMTHTAGLLFSSARGILDSWIVKKPTGCQSEPNVSSASNTAATTKRTGLVRARSLNGVPEHVGDQAPPPPPPPPPRPPQNGWTKKVPTPPPPTCLESRRHSASYGVHAPKKTGAQQHPFVFSGKYGKQVKVG